MTFLPHRQVDNPLVTVQCRGVAVPTASTTTYLGVVLDSKLSWDAQVDRIVSKITRKISALWRARRSLSRSARHLFVQAVVIPDVVYGSNAFFSALLGRQLDRLGLLQNRAIRAIDGHPPYTTLHPLPVQHGLYRIGELSKAKATSHGLSGGAFTGKLVPRCLYCSSDLLAGEPVIRGPVVCSVSHPPLALALLGRPPQDLHSGTCCRMTFGP